MPLITRSIVEKLESEALSAYSEDSINLEPQATGSQHFGNSTCQSEKLSWVDDRHFLSDNANCIMSIIPVLIPGYKVNKHVCCDAYNLITKPLPNKP